MSSISHSLIAEGTRGTLNILRARSPRTGEFETIGTEREAGASEQPFEWRIESVTDVSPIEGIVSEPIAAIPRWVNLFVQRVAAVEGVQCIVVEDGEDESTHVTTFASPLTEESREQIYDIEADTMQTNPNARFDFHLRRADEVSEGILPRSFGRYFFSVWGGLDAESR